MVGLTPEPLSLERQEKSSANPNSCSCLLSSISFLDKLASRSNSSENRIDLLLANLRNSLETLAIFVACGRCETRVEQNMLLSMAARQISVICEKTARCYKSLHQRHGNDTNLSRQRHELNGSVVPVDISVSTYRVNQREMLHMLGNLVTLQIVEFQQHINTIKGRFRNEPNQGQAEALVEAENYIKSAQFTISSHLR